MAISIAIAAFVVLYYFIPPFGSSWLIRFCSTLVAAWIIKSTTWALKSLNNRSTINEGMNQQLDDNSCEYDNNDDRLKSFESLLRKRMEQTHFGSDESSMNAKDTVEGTQSNNATTSIEIDLAKKFLIDNKEEERHRPPSVIPFPALMVLITALSHSAVRCLVILQNIRRSWKRRRRSSSQKNVLEYSNLPIIIGRSMSSSGCAFQIFSFLNRWLETHAADDDAEMEHTDYSSSSPMSLKAISIDRISIASSFLVMNQTGQHSAATSRLSRFGIRFESIDMRVTILMKNNRRKGDDVSKCRYIQSTSFQLRIKALDVGLNRCRGSGIQLDTRVLFDDYFASNGDQTNISFGLSGTLNQFTMMSRAHEGEKLVSWDEMQSSVYLNLPRVCDTMQTSRRLLASSITIPSGIGLIRKEKNTWITSSSPSRRVHLSLEKHFSFGIDLESVQRILSLLQDTTTFPQPVKNSLAITDNRRVVNNGSNNKIKTKSSTQIVELNANINMHVFTFISKYCDEGGRSTMDFFSFESPGITIRYTHAVASLPDSTCDQMNNDVESRCHLNGIRVQRHTVYGDQLNSKIAVRDLVCIKQIQGRIESLDDRSNENGSQCAIVDVDGVFVRADGEDVNTLACIMKLLEDTKQSAQHLQNKVHTMEQALSSYAKSNHHASSVGKISGKQTLSRIALSCNSLDVVVELLPSSEMDIIGGSNTTGNDTVRFALFQTETHVRILLNRESLEEEPTDRNHPTIDLLPKELFHLTVKKCTRYHLLDASIGRAEGSVTFIPHPSLPVIRDVLPPNVDEEISFYGKFSNVTLTSALPLKSQLNTEISVMISKAMYVDFDSLTVYECVGKISATGVHKLVFAQQMDWPMERIFALDMLVNFAKIVQCKCSVSMTDERNVITGERVELISVQFSRGPAELEFVLSTVLMWLEVSCNNRIQNSLAFLRRICSSNRELPKRMCTSHKRNFRVVADPNVRANIDMYVGVKSKLGVVIEGGAAMNVSMAKFASTSSIVLNEFAKPNVAFEGAGKMHIAINDSMNSIFVIDGISFNNYTRRANSDEIDEYSSKIINAADVEGTELLASDHEGHPLKEIFELSVGSSMIAKFPPTLHFGQVIEDMNLFPKALFEGLNRLKGNSTKPMKKYQLMTIKCSIPFFDVSLTDYVRNSETSTTTEILRDVYRTCFETVEVVIERSTPPRMIQAQINEFDEDDSSTHEYGPQVQGGLFCLNVKHVICILHPLTLVNPLIRVDNYAINGILYLATLSPNTPGVQGGNINTSLLLCHHNHYSRCYGVSLHSSGLPVKIYTNSQVKCAGMNLTFGPVLNDSISRLMECIQRLLPPAKEASGDVVATKRVTWWDNLRFFIHGSISLTADDLTCRWLLDSHTYWDQSIIFHCHNCQIRHSVGLFEMDAYSISVSIPGTAYDTSIHPSIMRTMSTLHLPHEAESAVSKQRHPLLYVPTSKTRIEMSWEMDHVDGVSYKHHSVNMQQKHNIDDKFSHYRSEGVNVHFSIEIPGSDGTFGADNWVALRVDVLPWFTHINSSSTQSTKQKESDSSPLPVFRSVAVKANAQNMKMATWFEEPGEEDVNGLCLTIGAVKYNASIDGDKSIVIEGPVKVSLLDVSEFDHVVNAAGDIGQQENKELIVLEQIASELGALIPTISDNNGSSTRSTESHRVDDSGFLKLPFLKLQELSSKIRELDYIVQIRQIDICNKSMERVLAPPTKRNKLSLEKNTTDYTGMQVSASWAVLVSRVQILWTLEIRDSLMGLSKDLIYTFGFINSQLRQVKAMANVTHEQDSSTGESHDLSSSFAGESNKISNSGSLHQSGLAFLLKDSAVLTEQDSIDDDECIDRMFAHDKNASIPTLEIHLSNPQVQMHSIATGGSILLAMEKAQVEAREFIHFIALNRGKAGDISTNDLLKKTEHAYRLTNMEAYSLSTRVDVNLGLPWLEVSDLRAHQFGQEDSVQSHGERDDESRFCYLSRLQPHQPMAFFKSKLLRPILDKFTFQSTQIFHRPPIHYSTKELKHVIEQGLVVNQNAMAVDEIQLFIDLLSFKLDSYQFKTSLDVLKNVLLEAPKPHQRHQGAVKDKKANTKTSEHMDSAAATEIEQILSGTVKYRDKKVREILKNAAMTLLRDLEDKIAIDGDEVFRRITYSCQRVQWSMQSHDSIDDVLISFTGFNGQHDYTRDGTTKSQFSLEDVR